MTGLGPTVLYSHYGLNIFYSTRDGLFLTCRSTYHSFKALQTFARCFDIRREVVAWQFNDVLLVRTQFNDMLRSAVAYMLYQSRIYDSSILTPSRNSVRYFVSPRMAYHV